MTQEGEKELVLGNKQLISLFFVGVALCGVFFALGYMIGHNSRPPATANLDAAASTPPAAAAAQTQDSEPPRETAASEAQVPTPTLAETQPPPADAEAPLTKTRAALDRPEPQPDTAAVPQPGATYLQVTALRRDDADKLVKTLKEQNFPALLADSSKPDLFRVMVGPYHQTADVAEAKARLKALGFANSFVQK
ncbi:MAG TPA: SPOR domain-containing protein [Bryobacteraceae bacterium]|jgi:cell division septation protein DedD|nr:SPOR domain-containing protein [Bryobacteraceae bacterium]